jgi:hypothetical protein
MQVSETMTNGRIRIKTLVKFLKLCDLTKERNRLLEICEVIQEIHCCESHAYNYQRALKKLFPPETFDLTLPQEGIQQCLM